MYQLIKDFPEQLAEALLISKATHLHSIFNNPIKNIVISGLGGSGIGGDILNELVADEITIPIVVNKGYFLPKFVDASTLLILCSYSGNTEETVQCANQAIERGLTPICVTSGGKLAHIAKQHNFDLILIPAGFPPRACLGYSSVQLFYILHHFGLLSDAYMGKVTGLIALLKLEQTQIMQQAEALAAKLVGKVIVLYSDEKYASVAVRIKQQINENSKLHCWYNSFPEMNHNELVGWRERNDALAVILLRASDEYNRNSARIEFCKNIITKLSDNVYEVTALGANTFEKHFYLMHFGDWLSHCLAVLQGYDPNEIDVLIALKAHMGSIQ